jgi:hypothetical protein
MSDDLKSFTISQQVKPRVDRPGASAKGKPGEASVGFPLIEALLETEEPDVSGLNERLDGLQQMASTGSMKDKAAAGKAAIAYERTADLLEHLFATKSAIGSGKKTAP